MPETLRMGLFLVCSYLSSILSLDVLVKRVHYHCIFTNLTHIQDYGVSEILRTDAAPFVKKTIQVRQFQKISGIA